MLGINSDNTGRILCNLSGFLSQIVTDDASGTVRLDTIGCPQKKGNQIERSGEKNPIHLCASSTVRTFIKVRLAFGPEAGSLNK